MNRPAYALILFILSVTSAYGQAFIVRPAGIVIENSRHYFNVQIWNCTSRDVAVPLADLPWGQNTLGLVLYPASRIAGEPLKESIPAADFPDTKIKIQAKDYVEGRVDLDSRFLGISRYEGRSNLIVFWVYDLSLITGGRSQFVGGMVPFDGSSSAKNVAGTACK
jgi:hypothetical protein